MKAGASCAFGGVLLAGVLRQTMIVAVRNIHKHQRQLEKVGQTDMASPKKTGQGQGDICNILMR